MENDFLEKFVKDHPILADGLKELRDDLGWKDSVREEVLAAQASMAESASHFLDTEQEDLRVVIRLSIEFFHYLQHVNIDSPRPRALHYVGDSIFSGIDSFCSLCHACRGISGARRSALPQHIESLAALKQQFTTMYRDFAAESKFDRRCRLLLDLFRLQLVFAGLTYDGMV